MPIKKEIKDDPIKYAEYLENKKQKKKENKDKIQKYMIELVAKRAGVDKEDIIYQSI